VVFLLTQEKLMDEFYCCSYVDPLLVGMPGTFVGAFQFQDTCQKSFCSLHKNAHRCM